MSDSLIGKGTINIGATCGQDFSYFKYPRPHDKPERVFSFYYADNTDRVRAEAYGYGLHTAPDSYGNGAIYLSALDMKLLPKEDKMSDSFKTGFDYVVRLSGKYMNLSRKNGTNCMCPFNANDNSCSSLCPHFVIENCSIVDKRCQLILTCGKNISRLVEIIE